LIIDRAFNSTSLTDCPVPGYVLNLGGALQGCALTQNGPMARIWRSDVMDRQIALLQAICNR
jgi:hypothetical protein